MDDELLPTTIYVMDGDNVVDVIYGNERKDVLKIGGIVIATKTDPDTKKERITKRYKITKVIIEKNEFDKDELKVNCVIIG